jgi:hypothetical protein
MKFEAVVVCINYSDFLKVTLPHSKHQFAKLVVVTDTKDIETARVCEFYNVQCVKTDVFYRDGPIANKALGINEGLKYLTCDDWVIQMDADIWLPPLTSNLLHRIPLEKDCLYGIDRMMCNSYNEWVNFVHSEGNNLVHEGWVYLHMHHFPIGQRIVDYNNDGYYPIGYFQLWNPRGSGVKDYPVEIVGYDRTDVLHAKKFDRLHRKLIPDFVCIHLASEEHDMGQNWKGRKTKMFGPDRLQTLPQPKEIAVVTPIHEIIDEPTVEEPVQPKVTKKTCCRCKLWRRFLNLFRKEDCIEPYPIK